MKYVGSTNYKGVSIPIFLGELDGAYAISKASKNPFNCGDNIISKYQIILDKVLLDHENDFFKYIFYHEIGHIDIFMRYENGEFDFKPSGTFKEELYCDMFSLKHNGDYNLDFIDYLREYEEITELQRMILKYMKLFIKRNVFENIDKVLSINFDCVEDDIYSRELINYYIDDCFRI